MTYCVGLLLNEGMVLLSDTRTNAGLDHISSYRKMFRFEQPGERTILILTAGNLSTTQATLARLQEEIDHPDATADRSIMLAPSMLKVAEIVGGCLWSVRDAVDQRLKTDGKFGPASMIVAGQRKGGAMRMFLIYPEGNFIEASEDTPFIQIGEHKYGKPILDRMVRPETSLENGQKAVLLSMDSTLRSNLSVGMPLDIATIRKDELRVSHQRRIEPDDPGFRHMSDAWSKALRSSFEKVPLKV